MALDAAYVCPYCNGNLKEKMVSFTEMYLGKEVYFSNVPADVCKKCNSFFLRNIIKQKVIKLTKEAPFGKSEIEFSK